MLCLSLHPFILTLFLIRSLSLSPTLVSALLYPLFLSYLCLFLIYFLLIFSSLFLQSSKCKVNLRLECFLKHTEETTDKLKKNTYPPLTNLVQAKPLAQGPCKVTHIVEQQ
jgi:hypothetical protein